MSMTLPQVWIDQIQRIHGDSPWVWCWEIEADQDATQRTVFRLVAYPEPVVLDPFVPLMRAFGQGGDFLTVQSSFQDGSLGDPSPIDALDVDAWWNAAPTGATFYPLPMTQGPLTFSGDGSLVTVLLSIGNTARTLTRWFEIGQGFRNKRAAAYLVNLADKTKYLTFGFRVARASVNAQTASLSLELPNWFLKELPEDRYDPHRCRHAFGRARCGYVINAVAAFTSCPRHVAACFARGLDMKSRNLPQLQPRRFGGFLGLPTAP